MDAKIPGMQLPTGATVDITPFVARQNVNVFVKREISTQLGAAEPNLLVGERPCWSVPVVLSFPDRGIVGKVGEILVDATTGALLVDQDTIPRMSHDADRLAERSALQAGAK